MKVDDVVIIHKMRYEFMPEQTIGIITKVGNSWAEVNSGFATVFEPNDFDWPHKIEDLEVLP